MFFFFYLRCIRFQLDLLLLNIKHSLTEITPIGIYKAYTKNKKSE